MPSQQNSKGNSKSKKRNAKRKRQRRIRILVSLMLIVLLIPICIGGYFFGQYNKNLKPMGDGSHEVAITIHEGETFKQVLNDLKENGLIQSEFYTNLYAKLKKKNTYYAGIYDLNNGMTVPEILDHLEEKSNVYEDNIMMTVPEGKWAKEVAEIISQNFDYSQQEIIDQWNDSEYLKELCEDYEFLDYRDINHSVYKVKLEGYLFPNTYEFKKDATIDEITRTFLDHFDTIYEKYESKFKASKYTIHELVTLASVVQFESSSADSMKTIAGVFYNRLNDGMMLQSSVTVCYALYDDFNDPMDCEVETNINSPYNTYLHKGLPIGPILNPGEDAIIAVLEPRKTDYYFFAADIYGKLDGKIHYSKTIEEHEAICRKMGLFYEETIEEE
ncbi:MAG: endolytic transglycosylase MltG [Bacillota bacterium]|nr:endolytic transglycosylase MltG [Bacillota bacterium]